MVIENKASIDQPNLFRCVYDVTDFIYFSITMRVSHEIDWETILTFNVFTSGIASLKITSPPEINVTLGSNSSFILNCTFELEGKEKIAVIYWKKKTNNGYVTLVNFYEYFPEYTEYGKYLQSRSKPQTYGNGSTSAVLIINDVRCEDVGQYQCQIKYGPDAPKQIETNTTVYVQGTIFILHGFIYNKKYLKCKFITLVSFLFIIMRNIANISSISQVYFSSFSNIHPLHSYPGLGICD